MKTKKLKHPEYIGRTIGMGLQKEDAQRIDEAIRVLKGQTSLDLCRADIMRAALVKYLDDVLGKK